MAAPSCPLCSSHTELIAREDHPDGDLWRCREVTCQHQFFG